VEQIRGRSQEIDERSFIGNREEEVYKKDKREITGNI